MHQSVSQQGAIHQGATSQDAMNKGAAPNRMHELAKACMLDMSSLRSASISPVLMDAPTLPQGAVLLPQTQLLIPQVVPPAAAAAAGGSSLNGLSLLCALAEQRIHEETSVGDEEGPPVATSPRLPPRLDDLSCSALSSLADVAASSISVPTASPGSVTEPPGAPEDMAKGAYITDQEVFCSQPTPRKSALSPRSCKTPPTSTTALHFGQCTPERTSAPIAGTSTFLNIPSFKKVYDKPVFGASAFAFLTETLSTPVKSSTGTDVNRNYKSPQSERDAKAFIANKASQYQKDSPFKLPFGFAMTESMDPAELDMRMQMAEVQRKYREKQKELSRLQPKKASSTPAKRGPGRPPKRKVLNNDTPGKRKVGRPSKRRRSTKELSPPILEPVGALQRAPESEDEEREGSCSSSSNGTGGRSILKPPVLTASAFSGFHSSVVGLANLTKEADESSDEDGSQGKSRRWSVSSEDAPPPALDTPPKPPTPSEDPMDESEGEQSKDSSEDPASQDPTKALQGETSMESSPSDLEQQPALLSSSKKRKPGK